MPHKKQPQHKGAHGNRASAPFSQPYEVDMTDTAAKVYQELYRHSQDAIERGDITNAHCTTFNMVREVLKEFIPRNPIDKQYALEGALSNIFRIKKGRMRICWIASSEQRRVLILFISETARKAGDINDPYEIFTRMVMSGQYNDFFARLGVRIPKKTMPGDIHLQ